MVDDDSSPEGLGNFEGRFTELASIAYRVAFRLLGTREDAHDVAQETMARAFVHWGRASPHAAPWVSKVSANLAIDLIRRRNRTSAHERQALEIDDHRIERLDLVAALAALSRRQREVLVLRYVADLPESEVAAALGCSTGTIKQHTSRGLEALRRALESSEPIPITPEMP